MEFQDSELTYVRADLLRFRSAVREAQGPPPSGSLAVADRPESDRYVERPQRNKDKEKAKRPIAVVTEFVQSSAEDIRLRRDEIKRVAQETGAEVNEKVGLKGSNLEIRGPHSKVEKAVEMLEDLLSKPPPERNPHKEVADSEDWFSERKGKGSASSRGPAPESWDGKSNGWNNNWENSRSTGWPGDKDQDWGKLREADWREQQKGSDWKDAAKEPDWEDPKKEPDWKSSSHWWDEGWKGGGDSRPPGATDARGSTSWRGNEDDNWREQKTQQEQSSWDQVDGGKGARADYASRSHSQQHHYSPPDRPNHGEENGEEEDEQQLEQQKKQYGDKLFEGYSEELHRRAEATTAAAARYNQFDAPCHDTDARLAATEDNDDDDDGGFWEDPVPPPPVAPPPRPQSPSDTLGAPKGMIVQRDFLQAEDYGPEYLLVEVGDRLEQVSHEDEGDGWIYVKLLPPLASGTLPPRSSYLGWAPEWIFNDAVVPVRPKAPPPPALSANSAAAGAGRWRQPPPPPTAPPSKPSAEEDDEEEAERLRARELQEQQKLQKLQQQKQKQQELEAQRRRERERALEEEKERVAREEELKRKAAEEKKRIVEEALRRQEEAAAAKRAEAEKKAAEEFRKAEAKRKAAEAEAARKAEAKRKAEEIRAKQEEERQAAVLAKKAEERRRAEEAAKAGEMQRKAVEAARKAELERERLEEERQLQLEKERLAAEEKRRKEDEAAAAAAALTEEEQSAAAAPSKSSKKKGKNKKGQADADASNAPNAFGAPAGDESDNDDGFAVVGKKKSNGVAVTSAKAKTKAKAPPLAVQEAPPPAPSKPFTKPPPPVVLGKLPPFGVPPAAPPGPVSAAAAAPSAPPPPPAPDAAVPIIPGLSAQAAKLVAEAAKAKAKAKAKTPAAKPLNPLPKQAAKAQPAPAPVPAPVNNFIRSENAASSAKWADRPVTRLAAQPTRYEEEEDPELAQYLWNRQSQRPQNDQHRVAPKPMHATQVVQAPRQVTAEQKNRLLDQVLAMGFDELAAKRALATTGWSSVEAALSILFD